MQPTPQTIKLEPYGVSILWRDGHRSIYPYKYLRVRCHCAACVEEWTGAPLLDPDTVPEDITAVDYLQVGNYAVQFLWTDLHVTGIYPYECLRQMCPCAECTARRIVK